MKCLGILMLLPLTALAASSTAWLDQVPTSVGARQGWQEIPNENLFEVPASKLSTAEARLSRASFLAQEQGVAAYFGNRSFRCVAPAKVFLVRAAYIHGGTGSFTVYWAQSALVVSHDSLGSDSPPAKSALVACLSKAPTAVFSSLSTDL
jgi:hypothetical protein